MSGRGGDAAGRGADIAVRPHPGQPEPIQFGSRPRAERYGHLRTVAAALAKVLDVVGAPPRRRSWTDMTLDEILLMALLGAIVLILFGAAFLRT